MDTFYRNVQITQDNNGFFWNANDTLGGSGFEYSLADAMAAVDAYLSDEN